MSDEIAELTRSIANLAERIRRLEAQEVALTAGAPISHSMVGAQHTYAGGAALDVFGLSGAGTIAKLTPSSAPGAASAILKSDAAGGLDLTGGIQVGAAPTGGDLGAGTVNAATGLYVNNVAAFSTKPPTWLGGLDYVTLGASPFESLHFNAPIAYNYTITQIVWTIQVNITNDGTKYWTIDLVREDTDASIISLNTSTYNPDTWYRTTSAYAVAVTTGMVGLYIKYTATGAVGSIYMYPPIITAV